MPLDPLADDFGGRVNELTADDLSSEEKDATEPAADCDEPVDQPREPDSKNTGPPTDSGHRQQQILFSDATTAPTHPAPAPAATPSAPSEQAVTSAAPASPEERAEPVDDSHRPYTLEDHQGFWRRLHDGQVTVTELQATFTRVRASRDALIAGLVAAHNATQLKVLATRFGCFDAKRNTKQQNAEAVYRATVQSFALAESVVYRPMAGETIEDAVAKMVEEISDEQIAAYVKQTAAEQARREKAMTDPETLDEFHLFVQRRGEGELNDEQLACHDVLQADRTRQQRSNRKPTTVEQIHCQGGDGLTITITEGFHEKRQVPLWICQLSDRVDKTTFCELKRKASQLGGWWSSFKRSQAGFQFTTEESAHKFAGLLDGDADRTDELAARHQRKLDKASGHLAAVVETLQREAAEILQTDSTRLQNTARRAEMAAGMRGRAYAAQALAGTLRSVAAALESGESQYLDGVRTRTQVQLLLSILRRAKWARNRQLSENANDNGDGRLIRHEDLDHRPIEPADVVFARYRKQQQRLASPRAQPSSNKVSAWRLPEVIAQKGLVDFASHSVAL